MEDSANEEPIELSEEELIKVVNKALASACPGCSIKTVYRLSEEGQSGSNWTFSVYTGPTACAETVRKTLDPLRAKYSLKKRSR